MSEAATLSPYGARTEPATVRIQRLLPGGIDRVWAYLTESDLRRQWLAAGSMDLKIGGEFELVWRNDELSAHPEPRPSGADPEHRMKSRITRLDPPRLLAFEWGGGEVAFELERIGDDVLLTVTHRRISDFANLLKVSAGWHAHLDILSDRTAGRDARPFWSNWARLKAEYTELLAE